MGPKGTNLDQNETKIGPKCEKTGLNGTKLDQKGPYRPKRDQHGTKIEPKCEKVGPNETKLEQYGTKCE